MSKKIGILTIGQSPRDDVVPEMAAFFGKNVEILESGALDGLTLDQVKALSPEDGMAQFVTRMGDGSEVIVAKEKLLPLMEKAIGDLNRKEVSLILLLCVGDFPSFQSSCLIVQPQKIVDRSVESLIGDSHRLGILIPIPEQEDWVRETFSRITSKITVAEASPYSDRDRLSRAGQILEEANCDLIVMYCMGFNRKLAAEIRRITGKPVILSSSLVARTLGELLE
jgi:protein AroM